MVRIILCADDYGIAPGVNEAIRTLIGMRRLNATSVMVVAPSFSTAAANALHEANSNGNAAIGLHLTLTAPYAPLTGVSGRLAPNRKFLSLPALMARTFARALDAAALNAEVAAQIAAFRTAFGHAPDFVDGHQHAHLLPQVREAVLAAVKARAPTAWVRQCGATNIARALNNPKGLLVHVLSRRLQRAAKRLSIPTNPAFAGAYTYHSDADFAALFPRFLAGLPQGALVMCHPGKVDAELRRLDSLTDLREREYEYLLSEDFPRALAERTMALQ